MPPEGKSQNYYDVLGLLRTASDEEIRKTYFQVVRTVHPDKSRRASVPERFHEVQAAWRVLSDPTRRLMYDLRTFGDSFAAGSTSTADMGEILMSRQKDQAALDLRNMEVELQRIVQKEQKKRGVLVKQALYGNLQLRPELLHRVLQGDRQIRAEDLQGPWIDVTTAVQCLVEQSSIRVHGSSTFSKADLAGFYNPTPLNSQIELSLYVLYDFRDTLHEVIVEDRETLMLPIRKHLVQGDHPRGPFPSSNVELLFRRRQLEADAESISSPCSRGAGRAVPETKQLPRRLRTPEQELAQAVKRWSILRLLNTGGKDVTLQETRWVIFCASAMVLAVFAVLKGRP